jgi:hypothetical protein
MNSPTLVPRLSLDTFPTELLYAILFYVIGFNPNILDVLPLRTVSRKWRAIVNGLEFWHHPEFLICPTAKSWRRPCSAEDIMNDIIGYSEPFLRDILSDGHLVGSTCLGRKTSWHFESLESLNRVVARVPGFQLSCKSIILSFLPSSPSSTFDTLQQLNVALVSLTIANVPFVDLDVMCEFDSLQHLTLMRSSYKGKLSRISTLRSLRSEEMQSTLEAVRGSFLPLGSATILERLSLVFLKQDYIELAERDIRCPFYFDQLQHFKVLKELKVWPVWNTVCRVIAKTDIRLSSLDLYVDTVSEYGGIKFEDMISIFAGTGLSSVKTLRFTERGRWNAENRKEIFQAMTGLPMLVDLELSPLWFDWSWIELFRGSSLKSLKWSINGSRVVGFPYRIQDMELEQQMYQEFGKIFQDLPEPPHLEIKVASHIAMEEVDTLL